MTAPQISLHTDADDADVAYLMLPGHPGEAVPGAAARQVRLSDILAYEGADVFLDLDAKGRLIGLEILA